MTWSYDCDDDGADDCDDDFADDFDHDTDDDCDDDCADDNHWRRLATVDTGDNSFSEQQLAQTGRKLSSFTGLLSFSSIYKMFNETKGN